MRLLLPVLLLTCAHSAIPTLALYPLDDPQLCWTCDGSGTVFEIDNPTNQRLRISYRCEWIESEFSVVVDAKHTWRGVGQLLNKERFTAPCWITGWNSP